MQSGSGDHKPGGDSVATLDTSRKNMSTPVPPQDGYASPKVLVGTPAATQVAPGVPRKEVAATDRAAKARAITQAATPAGVLVAAKSARKPGRGRAAPHRASRPFPLVRDGVGAYAFGR